MKARAQIVGDTVRLSFPFSQALINRIKREVPASCRGFDPDTKVWTVHDPYVTPAVALVYVVYPNVVIDDRTGTHAGASWRSSKRGAKKSARTDPDYSALHLLPSAPDPLVDAAYRCLARLHHPDAGGDTTTMQQLNAARDAIRSRRAS